MNANAAKVSVNAKKIATIGMLLALQVIAGRFFSIKLELVTIGFIFLPLSLTGALFGPIWGGVAGVLGDFLQAPQDKSESWLLASALTLLRYLCMLGTLLLPALYVAMVTFHQEMIPTRLALSIIAAKQDVPFRSVFEVIVLLLAFEILQEAGLRLPQSIGQTVSIIGGLVVGSAAVEAKIISPAVLIVVAIAGIAGYTMPSQEVAGALRIWRFLLALLASAAGLFGVVAGLSALVIHLAGIESFGVSYLTPFASNAGEQVEGHAVFRQPLPQVKQRPAALKTRNRRNQK